MDENEIKEFGRNDGLTRKYFKKKKKDPEQKFKPKGKGKNRRNIDPQAEAQKKILRAEKKRKEREEAENLVEEENRKQLEENEKVQEEKKGSDFEKLEKMSVDDDFDYEDDFEACNAPSTRKANSENLQDSTSPFFGDNILSFSEKAKEFIVPEEKKIKIDFDIPTKSAQLECDLRSLK